MFAIATFVSFRDHVEVVKLLIRQYSVPSCKHFIRLHLTLFEATNLVLLEDAGLGLGQRGVDLG